MKLTAKAAQQLEVTVGPNWRTTLSGIASAIFGFLTVISATIATPEGQKVLGMLPPAIAVKVAVWTGLITVALRVMNSIYQKDKNVSGGDQLQNAAGKIVLEFGQPGTVNEGMVREPGGVWRLPRLSDQKRV
jgi:membrane-bound ClpP family serine protease